MKNILLTITVVLLQIATANSKNNNTTYIKLSIGDCGTCTNVLHNPKVFLEYTDSVVVMLPQKYKNNTGKVLELFPELTNDIFRVRYTDTLLNGMENGTTSYIYKYEDGVCIKKMPLKFFTPNEFYGKKQQSTRLSISKIDTTKTTNTSPLEMYDVFLTANGTIFAIDVLDNI
jgi:hypothetical protein